MNDALMKSADPLSAVSNQYKLENVTQLSGIYRYRDYPIKKGAVAFILPCHNEEKDLRVALESVLRQRHVSLDTILVVSDNSTDKTVEIARQMQVSVIETQGNHFKKAGALNAGIRHLMQSGYLPEFIITGDGDTEYDDFFVRNALNVMRSVPNLGVLSAVCYGKTGLLERPNRTRVISRPKHRMSGEGLAFLWLCIAATIRLLDYARLWANYLLVWLQSAEYARAAFLRVRHNIHTMSGAGSMIRAEAMVDVLYAQQALAQHRWQWESRLYREHAANLVEDFALTLDIKAQGWVCTNNTYVVAHTDLMTDFSSLLRQRMRWVRGTIDELRRRKFSPESRVSSLVMIGGLLSIPLFYVWPILAIAAITAGYGSIWQFWMFPVMGTFQALTVRRMGWRSMLLSAAIIPEMLFSVVRHYWIVVSVCKSFTSKSHTWA